MAMKNTKHDHSMSHAIFNAMFLVLFFNKSKWMPKKRYMMSYKWTFSRKTGLVHTEDTQAGQLIFSFPPAWKGRVAVLSGTKEDPSSHSISPEDTRELWTVLGTSSHQWLPSRHRSSKPAQRTTLSCPQRRHKASSTSRLSLVQRWRSKL